MTTQGYAIFTFSEKDRCYGEPLAYGRDDEPSPQMLLRRNRVELFPSKDAAERALKDTYHKAVADNCRWVREFKFSIVEVVKSGYAFELLTDLARREAVGSA